MKKKEIIPYNQILVEADRDFIQLQIELNDIELIKDSGLHSLLSQVQRYLDLPDYTEISIEIIKPVMVLNILSDILRELWVNNITFQNQLKAMNSGEFQYGRPSPTGKNNYKDFEFELFSASMLIKNKLNTLLPQKTDGNDIICEEIEIQCKHPNTISRNKVDKYLRAFQSSLHKNKLYGIFGIGLDDYIGFTEKYESINDEEFVVKRQKQLLDVDKLLIQIFDDTLLYTPRILGIYLVNTHFIFTKQTGLSLVKTANSVYCLREGHSIAKEILKNGYKILMTFNEKPSIRKFHK